MAGFNQLKRNIQDLTSDPRGYLEMVTDRMSNSIRGRQAVVDDKGLRVRELPREERVGQMTQAILDNMGSGGMGALGVIKNKGGNWLTGSVEGALSGLKKPLTTGLDDLRGYLEVARAESPELVPRYERELALRLRGDATNNWIDKQLTKYIKNEMATEGDPVRLAMEAFPAKKEAALTQLRKQIENATAKRDLAQRERGFTPEMMTQSNADIRELQRRWALEDARQGLHFTPDLPPGAHDMMLGRRAAAGFEPHGFGKTELAKQWEATSDEAVLIDKPHQLSNEKFTQNPWLRDVPKDINVHSVNNYRGTSDLGLDHMVDELSNAIDPESGLPKELLLNHADINKMTVPQIVEHVDKINAYRKVKQLDDNTATASNPAAHLVREYAENNPKGMRWVELKKRLAADEGDEIAMKELADQLKYEGDTMAHCVGGYCDDVASGKSRIFSLRDAQHRPHATIEVGKPRRAPEEFYQRLPYLTQNDWGRKAGAIRLMDLGGEQVEMGSTVANGKLVPALNEYVLRSPEYLKFLSEPTNDIVQIKGPRNQAPDPEMLPFVQDFVRNHPEGGKWGKVGDLKNTGLSEEDMVLIRKQWESR